MKISPEDVVERVIGLPFGDNLIAIQKLHNKCFLRINDGSWTDNWSREDYVRCRELLEEAGFERERLPTEIYFSTADSLDA
jgi:hypothetical protein